MGLTGAEANRFAAPELLEAGHDSSTFGCGAPMLDDWLRRRALPNQISGGSRTYVLTRANLVIGYFTLAAGAIAVDEAPGRVRRNMPDPIPMAVLGRLAIDRTWQGRGSAGCSCATRSCVPGRRRGRSASERFWYTRFA
jgi:hypothetical protein